MNIIEWRNTLCQDETVSPRGKHIGLTLSLFYRDNKRTYPTIDTLCEWSSTTFNTVSNAIKDLIKAGYIEKKPFRFPNAKFMGTEYIFCGVTPCNKIKKNEQPSKIEPAIQGAIQGAIQPSKIDDKKEEIEEKNNNKKNKQKKGERLLYQSLPVEWLVFCQDEMQWTIEQSESAFKSFYDYSNSPDCKNPLRKDWFMVFKNSCRNGITKPNINLNKGNDNDRNDNSELHKAANALYGQKHLIEG